MGLESVHEYRSLQGSTEHELNDLSVDTFGSSQSLPGIRILPASPHDVGVDQVSTPGRVHRFRPFIKRTWRHLAYGHEQPLIGPSQRDSRRNAWQGGLRGATIGASAILVLNAVLLFASIHFAEDGIVTLYRGSCSRVSVMNSGVHVLINVLSTIFLAASNYVMQVLNAPSRKHLDHYHARGRSLDIGLPSIKNVFLLGRRRAFLWGLLGISAIPLHLFWNSTVFQTLQTNNYLIFLVSSNFNSTNFSCNGQSNCDLALRAYDASKVPGTLEYLDTAETMVTYGANFLTGRRNLVLVGNTTQLQFPNGTTAVNESLFRVFDSQRWLQVLANSDDNPTWIPNYWWCGSHSPDPVWVTENWNQIVDLHIHSPPDDDGSFSDMPVCDVSQALARTDQLAYLTMQNNTVTLPWGIEYGLSETVDQGCQLGFAVYIMLIVVICNVVKVGSMIVSFWVLDDDPMVVIGDALSSFLEESDEITNGHCLMEAHDSLVLNQVGGTTWQAKQHYWFNAPSPFSLSRCILLCAASLIGSSYLLWMSIQDLSYSNKTFSDSTFAGVDPYTMIQSLIPYYYNPSSFSALAFAVLVANSPQLVYSTLYFMYNRLLTAMLAMDEWTRFQYHAATLRVSYPDRGQRSTYWLHLPYTYGLPLLVITSVMHWLLSESLFLARIQRYDAYGNSYQSEYSNAPDIIIDVGYSPKAIAATIAAGSAMVLGLIALSFRRYRRGIPLVGNNSLAISAACHPPEDDYDPAHSMLLWGAVDHGDETKPGKCCLTSKPVMEPIPGRRYA